MALLHHHHHHPAVMVILFGLAIYGFELSTGQLVKGKISCLDCPSHYDLSGIMVGVKCNKVKKLTRGETNMEGSFEVEVPRGSTTTTTTNCVAKLMGGTTQIYATNKNMVSTIVKSSNNDPNSYTTATPLAFSTSSKHQHAHDFDDSKTIDLPLPKEWGLAPSSYYFPFFPIIGIP